MIIRIGDDIVDIKVRKSWEAKATKESTMDFLNGLICIMREAASCHMLRNNMALSNDLDEKARQLHKVLASKGYYDE